ncbi:hypothetical protein DY000_02064400 [Brassica cretica]|uniref:Uncharacterized protein n=1 Tax=Brassica cretica TaxID=69181 RepID=A0ABQ7A432_BRACR|nr:hypothetical protein DY000_02064400 [Brassica cretica]
MASCPEDTSKLFGCVPAFKGELVSLILREPCCSLVKSCLCNQTVITDLILKVGSFDRLQGARASSRRSHINSPMTQLMQIWKGECLAKCQDFKGSDRVSTRETDWSQDKNFRFTYGARRDPHHQITPQESNPSQETRPTAKARLSFSRDSYATPRGASNSRVNNLTPRNEWRPILRESQIETGSKSANPHAYKSANSHISHTPSPRPAREIDILLQRGTPPTNLRPEEGSVPSNERRSALDRLSLPHESIPLLQDGVANAESGRLQEVDIQYLEETEPPLQPVERFIPSSSRNPILQTPEHYAPSQDRSPIRSLSEDRLHVSLRLGPLRDTNIEEEEEDTVLPQKESALKCLASTISRVDKGMPPQTKKCVCRSPLQGVSLKRRKVTHSQNSPRRKLLHDAIRSRSTNTRGA